LNKIDNTIEEEINKMKEEFRRHEEETKKEK
jgi:hypothetical protein